MIFSEKSIRDILNNNKNQTRRLVKKGEIAVGFPITELGGESKGIEKVMKYTKGKRNVKEDEDYSPSITKWAVGKSYAVQADRGKKGKGLWYCPNCKHIIKEIQVHVGKRFECACENTYSLTITRQMVDAISYYKKIFNLEMKRNNWKPLRIKITGIKKERLLDISEEDAKQEGYRSKSEFVVNFYRINNLKYDLVLEENKKLNILETIIVRENPEVWVLSIKGEV